MINLTSTGSGYLFDVTMIPGNGGEFASKVYYPFNSISSIMLYDDRVVGIDFLGRNFDLTITPKANCYPVSSVGGVPVTTLVELYDAMIALIPNW